MTDLTAVSLFADNWTDGQTDGHRYKQTGNAVDLPEWVIRRLVDVDGAA